jgi:hypothetical protein
MARWARARRFASFDERGRGSMNSEFKFPFEKLDVWHLAVDFADFILNILDSLPPNKYLRVIGQMEAAVSSIP